MNPMPQLASLLKQLRLSGIRDSLEARNRQAIDGQLAYADFLALLIQDEIARREQRQFSQRLRKAQVLTDKTCERFDVDYDLAVNRAQIADLATGRFINEHAPGANRWSARRRKESFGASARPLRLASGL